MIIQSADPRDRRAHLCLIQPQGYIHSLALTDPLFYLRDRLQRLGVEVTVAKNRLVPGALNYIFGAHLGFDAELLEQYSCVLVNLEKLGAGSIFSSGAYLDLLQQAPVLDYSLENTRHYAASGFEPHVITIGADRALARQRSRVPLEQRPIDVLFLGTTPERRRKILMAITRAGREITLPTDVLYGRQRNELIKSAKAVINIGADDSGTFEQVRASLVLSLGTPLISERMPLSNSQARVYEDAVEWLDVPDMAAWFTDVFATPPQLAAAQEQVDSFHGKPDGTDVAEMWRAHGSTDVRRQVHRPNKVVLNLAGERYRPGWLNLAISEEAQPDVLLDGWNSLERSLEPAPLTSQWGRVPLQRNGFHMVHIQGFSTDHTQIRSALHGAARLLAPEGSLVFEWPIDIPMDAIDQLLADSTVGNNLGGHLHVVRADGLDGRGRPCPPAESETVRIVMSKAQVPRIMTTVEMAACEDLELVLTECVGT